jgi:hypothetical protein
MDRDDAGNLTFGGQVLEGEASLDSSEAEGAA